MKKLLSLCLICLMAVSAMAQHAPASEGYVDLGLPSGTLWKNANEGGDDALYTYDEAVSMFGDKLPTYEQFEELYSECTWTSIDNGSIYITGYKVTGSNGNSITLPAAGERSRYGAVGRVGVYGYYWSSTPYDSDCAWFIYFYKPGVYVNYDYRSNGYSVRLVK